MAKLKIEPRVYIVLAVLIFLLPLKWLVAWGVAVCVHELFHFLAVKLYGGHIRNFSVALGGANMECIDLPDMDYLFSVLAGPIGGLVPVLLGRWFPRLAICSWLLSLYNLIPVLPLDGGRALRILFKNDKAFAVFQKIILAIIAALAVYLCFFVKLGLLPMVIVISLWLKNRKIPCKDVRWGVQ